MRNKILELMPDDIPVVFLEGFDEAIIGISEGFSSEYCVVYDKDKIIEILEQNMSYDEAIEYYEYNILGAYFGESTPKFITIVKENDHV